MAKYTNVDFFKLIINEKDDDFQSFNPDKDESPEEKKEPEPAPEPKEDNQPQKPDSEPGSEDSTPDSGEGDFGSGGDDMGGDDFGGGDDMGDDDFGGDGDDFGGDTPADTSGGATEETDMDGDFDEKNKNLSIISLIRTSYENLELIEKRLNEIVSRDKEEQDILDITSREIDITRKNVQHYLLHVASSKKYNENIAFLNNIRIHIELISKNMYYIKLKRIKK